MTTRGNLDLNPATVRTARALARKAGHRRAGAQAAERMLTDPIDATTAPGTVVVPGEA
jgi:hypothetical protein